MMKAVMVIFACVLAGSLALQCYHSRRNIRGEGNVDLSSETQNCNNGETNCVTATGNDKDDKNNSRSFQYRGCFSNFEKMNDTYHNPGCGGTLLNSDFSISGKLDCCSGNLCNNPASSISFSSIIIVLPISVLFYVFSW